MSQNSLSPAERVEAFQIRSSQVMFHPDFIQAGNLYHLLKSRNLLFNYTKLETKKAFADFYEDIDLLCETPKDCNSIFQIFIPIFELLIGWVLN